MSTTTVIRAGTLGGPDGELSVSYMPEYNAIYLFASVPNDRRRASISIRISDTAALREVVNKLESEIEAEGNRRVKRVTDSPTSSLSEDGGTVSIAVSGTKISLPRPLYEQAAELVLGGKTVLATSAVTKALPWLGASGAKEIAQAIYEHQRSIGLRE